MKQKPLSAMAVAAVTLATMVGCRPAGRANYVRPVSLVPDTTLYELGDSSFVPPQVRCIEAVGDSLYYTDYAAGQLVVLDRDYHVGRRIGSRGQGPGELLGAAHFCWGGNDSLYILNEGKQTVDLFVGGVYKWSVPFPADVRFTFNTRFFAAGGRIFHSVIHKDFPVVAFDKDTSVFLCSYSPHDNPSMGRHATKHLVKGEGNFFVIGSVCPTLQQYTMDGRLLRSFDLDVVPAIARMMQAYRDTPQDPESYFTVVQDVYYNAGYLYLLLASQGEGGYRCHTVAVVRVSGSEWEYTDCFLLSGKVYDTFFVSNGRWVAHDPSRSCLDVFNDSLMNRK